MASSNTDSPGTIYRWIERKPLTEAVTWTSREKFWLITAACHYGTHDWKSVAQVVRNAGEPYRPREWYTPKSCERQFKILVSNLSKEAKSLPLIDMLQHIAEGLKNDYIREANKSKDTLKSKYCNLFSILNRVKQGNLSRNEVVSLYSQARRNEIEGKQYMDQLMTRQNASLASENSSSGLIEEQPIKWNTPSAPLLTSLLRSRNTIPANRTATTIASLLQTPGGTSRTRSGKLLPLTPSIKTTQGTPTLSKLLEAPANPYISSPPQSIQKNKLSEVGTEKLANTSRKENSQSTSLNRVRVDNMTTLGSYNQINKSDLSASKRQISKSPVSAVKNGSKANAGFVDLLSDDSEEETKNASLKSLSGDKKDTSSRLEPRATRSQTRAEGGFKQLNDTKLSDGKKERESLQSDGSHVNESHLIVDDLIDIDQIDVEPLSTVQDEIRTQTPCKMTRSSMQRLRLSSSGDNLLTNKKVNSKEISNKMLEEISANFVVNSTSNTLAPEYKCLLGLPNNTDNTSECLIPVDTKACKDAIMIRKDSHSLQNTLSTNDSKLLKQRGVFGVKSSNIRCFDNINDSSFLSYNNQPIVVVNKIKKPFNIQRLSEQKNKTDNIQDSNTDVQKTIRLNTNSQIIVKSIDNSCSLASDEIIVIDDDININEDNMTAAKTKELSSKANSKILPLTVSSIPKSTTLLQSDEKKNKSDKTAWDMFAKTLNISDPLKKQIHQDSVSKSRTNCNINESNNRFIKELDFDLDQSISQTSLSELYNGVEEIVEMHSFDNEELNSLIECGSLDSNESEEHTVSVDQGDSSVSESDSTIGAFDTFAQITRVRKKSYTTKDVKFDTKESKNTNRGVKHLKESFCQSEEIYDDQTSTPSVTGIPILQGVISDVMSQINSDSVVSHKSNSPHNLSNPDIVEISSDEEFTMDFPKKHPLNFKPIQTQEKKMESYKFMGDESTKTHEIEAKIIKGVNMKHGTNAIKPLHIEMAPCKTDRAHNKKPTIKEGITQEYNDHNFDMTFITNSVNKRDENELNEVEVIQPQEITIKISNEKLMKETERMIKETKEIEERKKKEDERKEKEYERKIQEDNKRKKKENDERKKKEDERKKKEEDRKKRELEKKLQYELYEKKKREDDERKKKEEDQIRKQKHLDEIEEQKMKIKEKLSEFNKTVSEKMKTYNPQDILARVIVKEEMIEEDSEYLYGDMIYEEVVGQDIFNEVIRNDRMIKEGLMNEEQINEEVLNEEIINEEIINEIIIKEEIIDEELMNDGITNEEIINEEIINEEIMNEEIINEDIINEKIINENYIKDDRYTHDEYNNEIIERLRIKCNDAVPSSIECTSNSPTELTQLIDFELQLIEEESFKNLIKLKKYMHNRELKLTGKDVQVQSKCIKFQSQTNENQSKEDNTVEIQRSKEAEVQKSKEVEKQNSEEITSPKDNEVEMRRGNAAVVLERIEIDSVRIVEEVETKKPKEVESSKNISVEDTDIKGLNNRCTLKKVKELGNNRLVGHTEVNLAMNYGVSPVHFKKKTEHLENDTVIEQELIESRKVATNDDFETFNPRERGIKKCMESEVKCSKELETKSSEVKMITRTRGLKAEEMLKETNVSRYVSTKLRPQIKFSGSPSSSASPTIEDNSSIPSDEYKKPTNNTDDLSKQNSSSNLIYDNKNNRDINIDSSVIARKENLSREVIDIPRTRTRSSSFKQRTSFETRSSKQDQDDGAAIITKEVAGAKTIVPISTQPEHRTTRAKSPPKTIFNKHTFNDNNGGKTLIIPVVMLNTNEIPLHKIHQRSVNNFVKQKEIKPSNEQTQKQCVTAQLDKPPPKKRGRKRRIDELQEPNSNNKTTPQNVAKMNTLKKNVEAPAFRTRRSGLRGCKYNSTNKTTCYTRSRSTTDQPLEEDKAYINKQINKSTLKFVLNNLCEKNKYISSLNKEVTGVPTSCSNVLKCPVDLREIKRKITSSEITRLGELQISLLMMSFNAAMINHSTSIVNSDASDFQMDIKKHCREFKDAIGGNDSDNQILPKESNPKKINDYSIYDVQYPIEYKTPYFKNLVVNKKTFSNLFYNYLDNSSCEDSDSSNSDTLPLKKKRKLNMTYSSNSESD